MSDFLKWLGDPGVSIALTGIGTVAGLLTGLIVKSGPSSPPLVPALMTNTEFSWRLDLPAGGSHMSGTGPKPAPIQGIEFKRLLHCWVGLTVLKPPVFVEILHMEVQGQKLPAREWHSQELAVSDMYNCEFIIPGSVHPGSHQVWVLVNGERSNTLAIAFPDP